MTVPIAKAQNPADTGDTGIVCGSGGVDMPGCNKLDSGPNDITQKLLPKMTVGFVAFVALASVITLMISGIFYLSSLGNEEKIKKASKMIYYSLLGLFIAIFSYAIIQIVINLEFTGAS